MRNYLTSGGLLEEGRAFRDSQFEGQQRTDSDFESMPAFRPKDAAEDEYFRRTMVSAGKDADGTNLYHTPERSIYMKNKLEYQAQLGAAEDAFNKKINNPFFKATDFVTDLVRNTVGAPLNFLTDGVAFQSDPSKSAVKGYKAKIQELSDLQELNLEYFQKGRTTRASAFADSIKGTLANTASGTVRPNDKGEYVQAYQNGRAVVVRGEDGQPVKMLDKSKIYDVGGVPHRWNPVTQSMEPTIGEDKSFELLARQAEEVQFGKSRQTYFTERPTTVAMISSEKNRIANQMAKNVNGARRLIQDLKANGWNGLFSALPDSEAKALSNYLLTLKANVGFQALQEMRNNSITGGALGNVSEIELKQLNAVLGSLDQLTSSDQLLETLDTIEQKNNSIISIMETKMADLDRYYKYEDSSQQGAAPGGANPIDPQNLPPVNDEELQALDKMFGLQG